MIDPRHLAAAAVVLLLPVQASADADLARSKNCVACHHAERRMIGPSFTAIAERYANDASAVRVLSERVVAGGSGNWGQMPMPAQPTLSQAEAEALVRWILAPK